MKPFVLITLKNAEDLNAIQECVNQNIALSEDQRDTLIHFLQGLPQISDLLLQQIPFELPLELQILSFSEIEIILLKWKKLFSRLPGYDDTPLFLNWDELHLMKIRKRGTIMAFYFRPSMELEGNNITANIKLLFNINGTARFYIKTVSEAKHYPDLYSFNGSWKDAYYLVIETMRKGWPQEAFPKELHKFLKG